MLGPLPYTLGQYLAKKMHGREALRVEAVEKERERRDGLYLGEGQGGVLGTLSSRRVVQFLFGSIRIANNGAKGAVRGSVISMRIAPPGVIISLDIVLM